MRAMQDERLYALAFCDESGKLRYETPTYPRVARLPAAGRAPPGRSIRSFTCARARCTSCSSRCLQGNDRIGSLILVHDMSFVERRSADTRRYLIGLFVVLGVVVSLVTVFIAQLSWRGWVAGVRVAAARRGDRAAVLAARHVADLHPLASDLRALLRELDLSRRNPDRSAIWSPDMLRSVLREQLLGDEVHRRVEPRAVHPRAPRRRRITAAAAGERAGDRARAGDARLLRHLDRARQRQRRPRDRRRARPDARAAGQARATRCAASGSRRKRSRATTTASPTKACGRCATSRTCGRSSARRTGSSTCASTAASPTRCATRRAPRTRSCWCRTITSRCCRA